MWVRLLMDFWVAGTSACMRREGVGFFGVILAERRKGRGVVRKERTSCARYFS